MSEGQFSYRETPWGPEDYRNLVNELLTWPLFDQEKSQPNLSSFDVADYSAIGFGIFQESEPVLDVFS